MVYERLPKWSLNYIATKRQRMFQEVLPQMTSAIVCIVNITCSSYSYSESGTHTQGGPAPHDATPVERLMGNIDPPDVGRTV